MKFLLVLILLALCLTGCRKTKISPEFVENTEKYTVAVYKSADKYGVIHEDTTVYTNETMTEGVTIQSGTNVKIIGQSTKNYLITWDGGKGYILKTFVLVLDDEEDDDGTVVVVNDNGGEEIVKEEYTKIISELNFDELEDDTKSSVSPPTTLYTQRTNNSSLSKNLASGINKKRNSNNLSQLVMDKELTDVAEYHCNIFASEKKTYAIKNYSIQSVGKIGNIKDLEKLGEMIANKTSGFKNENTSKVGIAIVENGDGSAFYAIVAK